MKINNLNMPKEINENLINDWINKFVSCLSLNYGKEYSKDFSNDIILCFSDDILELPYKFKTIEEIIEEILKKYQFPNSDWIRSLKDIESLKACLNDIVGAICSSNNDLEKANVRSNIKRIMNSYSDIKSPYGCLLAGLYDFKTKTITLYNQVIKKDFSPRKSIEQAYEEVFVHELFHALHYYLGQKFGNKEIEKRSDYTSNVVKESLAAYFESVYCEYFKIETFIKEDWYNSEPSFYPYAGAKYVDNNFVELLEISYTDFDLALRELLTNNMSEFYNVKNIRYVKKQSKKARKIMPTTHFSDLTIEWKEGYQAFKVASRHMTEFYINNQILSITFSNGDVESRVISNRLFESLYDLFKTYKDALNTTGEKTYEIAPYGGIGSYYFRFEELYNDDVPEIFDNLKLNIRLKALLNRIVVF